MSKGPNHRRGHDAIQDHGPAWEGLDPSAGCNSTHVARGRASWRTMGRRAERRTGKKGANSVEYFYRRGVDGPKIDEEDRFDAEGN